MEGFDHEPIDPIGLIITLFGHGFEDPLFNLFTSQMRVLAHASIHIYTDR